jgi:hypothetical protein
MGRRRLSVIVATAGLAFAFLGAGAAIVRAELTANGNLFINFSGEITPRSLPRDHPAPITVFVSGKVRTIAGATPPSLRTIEIAINRKGRLDTRGLPRCRLRELLLATSAEALKACGDARVGTGFYRARTAFPEQARSPSHGKLLAFNASIGGHPAILAHVYGKFPARSVNVIIFRISHASKGDFGTVLTGKLPPGLSRWGYLKGITLRLHRNFVYRGGLHSYLSAPCEAPRGVDEASFNLIYTSLTFDDGRTLAANLSGTCHVQK